jgi:hypothetical protein
VITNNLLEESHYSSVSKQKALLKKIGCEMPKTIEATALLVVTFMSSGELLYGVYYTRCSEQSFGCFRPKVGGFFSDFICVDHDFLGKAKLLQGVGGVLRKF